jgi:hypothetical protein
LGAGSSSFKLGGGLMNIGKKRPFQKELCFVFLLLIFTGAMCRSKYIEIPDANIEQLNPVRKLYHLTIEHQKGNTFSLRVELARTDEEISTGLMYRKSLEPDRGMLFIFPAEKVNNFYMKNTYIPLDMIFIDMNKTIVGIVHEATPHTTVSRKVDSPSQYVLEVMGGYCKANDIQTGDTIRFDDF